MLYKVVFSLILRFNWDSSSLSLSSELTCLDQECIEGRSWWVAPSSILSGTTSADTASTGQRASRAAEDVITVRVWISVTAGAIRSPYAQLAKLLHLNLYSHFSPLFFYCRQTVTGFVWVILHSSLDGRDRKYLLSHPGQYQVVMYNMLYCALFSQVLINLRNTTFLHWRLTGDHSITCKFLLWGRTYALSNETWPLPLLQSFCSVVHRWF